MRRKVSRQRLWQRKKHAAGCCQRCGKPRGSSLYAERCDPCGRKDGDEKLAYWRRLRDENGGPSVRCGLCRILGHNRRRCPSVAPRRMTETIPVANGKDPVTPQDSK